MTAGINNFHNARGYYGEILPRQQPITARDFSGSNLCHNKNVHYLQSTFPANFIYTY